MELAPIVIVLVLVVIAVVLLIASSFIASRREAEREARLFNLLKSFSDRMLEASDITLQARRIECEERVGVKPTTPRNPQPEQPRPLDELVIPDNDPIG